MASSINASTSGGGGIITTADATGNLNIQSNGSTVVAVTATGASVTGTMAVSGTSSFTGAVTLTGGLNTPLAVLQGGTGVTTSTGTTNVVLSNSPTLVSPSISSAVMSTMASSVITSATAQTAPFTPTTSVTFTGIPSWAKRVTVMFSGIDTSTTGNPQLQLGTSGGIDATSTYLGSTAGNGGAASVQWTTGMLVWNQAAGATTAVYHGAFTLTLLTGTTWIGTILSGRSDNNYATYGGGTKVLSDSLTQVKFSLNAAGNLDAGTVNILYE